MIQWCWADGKQERTSYVSFPRAFCWQLVGKRRAKAGRERANNWKKRWPANDNSKKTSDYGWLAALKLGTRF
jgi:hypothetical protein